MIDLREVGQDKVWLNVRLEPGVISFASEGTRQAGPLFWSGYVERSGAEFRLVGSMETSIALACSRCLEPMTCSIDKRFDLCFQQRDAFLYDEDAEIELTEQDTRTAFFTGTELALADILQEQALLALPMKALCRPDCKGLCPACGTDLNFSACNCKEEQNNPTFESLLQMRRQLDERSK